MSNLVALGMIDGKQAIAALPEGSSLEDRFRAAAVALRHHWMLTNPDEQFSAACESLYSTANAEEQEAILAELRALRDLSALMSGVPVDLDAMVSRLETEPATLGLRKIWESTADV